MDKYTKHIVSRKGGREENQDSFGECETKHGHLFVVCDGMGGMKGGKTASQLAVSVILEEASISPLTDPGEILAVAIRRANSAVYQTSRTHEDLQGMGTTVVALLIDDEKATAAHVGDSRIYQVRGGRKVFRTFDHSMVFELVKRGRITEEQARLSAESNVISRAVGTKPDVQVEISPVLPYQKGDRFLLCSDGICGAVPEKELLRLVTCNKSVEKTAESVAETIDKAGFDNGGGHDNLTLALIETIIYSKIKPLMDRRSKTIIGILSLIILVLAGFGIWAVFTCLKPYRENREAVKELPAIILQQQNTVNSLVANPAGNGVPALKDSVERQWVKINSLVNSIK
ncbi:MAG: protein phosphatase 2C domain-containing protein [Tannerella sp.]|jgi:protein phosphatase|nr:protein phosphatase 2C domain-containing protein [Tannerella sp.]